MVPIVRMFTLLRDRHFTAIALDELEFVNVEPA